MRLIKVMNKGLLIRQGDSGDRCYIVVNGIVDVYVKKESEIPTPEAADDKPPSRPSRNRRVSAEPAPPSIKDYGNMVANLGPGAMFGEVVLLNPTAKRNATIVASQYAECCELICLERADYIRLVRTASMEASHYNHAEILDQMHLFRGWDKHGTVSLQGGDLLGEIAGIILSSLTMRPCVSVSDAEKMRLVSAMRSMNFISNVGSSSTGSPARSSLLRHLLIVVEETSFGIVLLCRITCIERDRTPSGCS